MIDYINQPTNGNKKQMGILKYIDRLKHMDRLIRTKSTGTPQEFADKVGVSRSTLMEHLAEMKELGARITFCTYRRCYQYEDETCLQIGFSNNLLSKKEEESTYGGQRLFQEIYPVRIYRTTQSYLDRAFG